MTAQAYFSTRTFRFLRALARHNERTWFHAHKAEYEQHVREPFLSLIADMQPTIAAISPHFRADPRKLGGSLFRIHRDLRFSRNKLPYKTWASARFFHERRRELQTPSFYLHIEPGACFVGAGLRRPGPETIKRMRAFLADNPRAWKQATRSKDFRRHFTLSGESLKRSPRGYPSDHELVNDLKRKSFVAVESFADALAMSDKLLPLVGDRFRRLAPFMAYFCAALDLPF